MTVKELSEFFGKSDSTIRRACNECDFIFENGKKRDFTSDEVKILSERLFKRVPLAVKESIKHTFSNDKGLALSNGELNIKDVIKSIIEPILKQQNDFNIMLLKEVKDVKSIKQIEIKQDYYSILGYMNLMNIDEAKFSEMICYGKEASKISLSMNMQIRKIPDERFGHVNSYHINVLKKVFEI